ncbi:hypothetical protein [Mammaliicoccus sciuri]|uniref:hypothetical protein n=1 Tax=Mammaliicoccus sciuri TaxID=1296 RepID=UPI001E655690|nr:hypothetical protein [Mammaliicoccus sciuri]MCD8898649.1 hypothetical protein [Mammaliicoccus sciuri]
MYNKLILKNELPFNCVSYIKNRFQHTHQKIFLYLIIITLIYFIKNEVLTINEEKESTFWLISIYVITIGMMIWSGIQIFDTH